MICGKIFLELAKTKNKMSQEKELQMIKQLLDNAENNIRQAKSIIFATEINKKARQLSSDEDNKIVEGVFDGVNMIGPNNKEYQVPANYASKSKLIPGDVLKLTILPDGAFIFKQIGPIPRKKVVAKVEKIDEGKYVANYNGKRYNVLHASVTYFKADDGDDVTIVIPEEGESEWAAIENII